MEIVFLHPEKVSLPENRRYPLAKGVLLLNRENQELLASHKTNASVSFELYESETEIPIYQGDFRLPVANFQFVDMVRADYERYEEITDDFLEFLNSLSKELGIKQDKKLLKTKESKQAKKQRTKPKKETIHSERNSRRSKVFLWIIGLLVFLLVLGIGFFSIQRLQHSPVPARQTVQKSTLDQMLLEGKYLQAAKNNPGKIEEIENQLFQTILDGKKTKINYQTLEQFQKHHPTTKGGFDKDFLNGEYQKMIQTYKRHMQSFNQDEIRMNLVGYAYLKIDDIEKAKEIAEQVQDSALAKKIASYELYHQQLSEKEQKVKASKPSNEEELKQHNQLLDDIYQLKQKIKNL